MSSDENNENFFDNLQNFNVHFTEALGSEHEHDLSLYNEVLENDKRYGEMEYLDKGGMKMIYSSEDYKTARKVAIAKLKSSSKPQNFEKFIKEARITAALEHPNIMPVYDLDVDEKGEPFFAMKYIKGYNLDDFFKKEQPGLMNLMQIYLKICDAIAYAHSKKIVHLDLKPANIQMGEFGEVLVCDWGLAKILGTKDETLDYLDPDIYNDGTMDGIVKGSLGYLAPEQVSNDHGEKDETTDIYALGGILYFMLTGKAPVSGGDTKISLANTIAGNIKRPSEVCSVPEGLEAVCFKALSLKQSERYSEVKELKSEIEKWLQGFATSAENAGFSKALYLLLKRHKTVSFLIGLTIVITSLLFLKIYLAEKESLSSLKLYVQEKENKEQMAKEEAPRLIGMGELAIKNYSFDEALNYANLAVLRDKENLDAWSLKGRAHFIRQEFNSCLEAFEKLGKNKHQRFRNLAQKYKDTKADAELMSVETFKEFFREFRHMQYAYLMSGYAEQNAPSLEFQLGIALFFLQEMTNSGVEDWHITYKKIGDQLEMDLSDHPNLVSISGIRNLPIVKLNVSNTQLSEIRDLEIMPLSKLDISGTKILDPRPLLRISTLTRLVIGPEQYQDTVFTIPSGVKITRKRK